MSEVNYRTNGKKYATHKIRSYSLASDWEYGDYLTKWNKKMTTKKNRRALKGETVTAVCSAISDIEREKDERDEADAVRAYIREIEEREHEKLVAWGELQEMLMFERLFRLFTPWFDIEGSLRG